MVEFEIFLTYIRDSSILYEKAFAAQIPSQLRILYPDGREVFCRLDCEKGISNALLQTGLSICRKPRFFICAATDEDLVLLRMKAGI